MSHHISPSAQAHTFVPSKLRASAPVFVPNPEALAAAVFGATGTKPPVHMTGMELIARARAVQG